MHEQDRDKLVGAVTYVGDELHQLHKAITAGVAVLVDNKVLRKLDKLETLIMTLKEAFDKVVTDQTAFNARQAVAIDSIISSQGGLAGDVAEMKRLIDELQNSPGELSPDDQARLDTLVATSEAAAVKAENVAAALQALDEQTAPTVPPAPPAA